MEQKNGKAAAGTALGIVSLIIAILGGIMFGVIGAGIALVLGVVAVVLSINAKKETEGAKGQAGFVCGLLGIIFAVIFAVGCAICGAAEFSGTKTNHTCYGCIGGPCMIAYDGDEINDTLNKLQSNDANNSVEELNDALNELQDMYE